MIAPRLTVLFLAVLTVCTTQPGHAAAPADPSILARVQDLQTVARQASGGTLGCGVGTYTLVEFNGTSHEVGSGLDPIHVFGDKIKVADITTILRSRVKSYRDTTPMTGEFGSLLYVCLYVLESSNDTGWVPLVKSLRSDPDGVVRRLANRLLIVRAKSDRRVRPMLRGITFSWDDYTDAMNIPEGKWPETPHPDWIKVGPRPEPYTGET